jgi:hypothetical protein
MAPYARVDHAVERIDDEVEQNVCNGDKRNERLDGKVLPQRN